ncbi:hypothetical protein SELMODRAFT_438305 [Selaginella moellendorffii]|uniref:J domain-containing protein n=1 Tax=Selaginella moellendorffii TaxID=88036 RepID=D8QVX6_SELML|nr:hypothetical protein SELMODRAFT_438305 [Selaginella moellendorffii]
MATHGPEALFGGFRGADGSRLRRMMDSSSSQRPVRPLRKRGIRVVVLDEDKNAGREKFACSDEEEDDDCKITGCWLPPKRRQSKRVGAKRPVKWNSAVSDHTATTTTTTTTTVDLSDCEVEIGAHSDIRKRWEEAAEKRKRYQSFPKAGKAGDGVSGAPSERKHSSGDESASTSRWNINESDDVHVQSMFHDQVEPEVVFKEHRHTKKQGAANGTSGVYQAKGEPSSGNKNLFSREFKEELRRCQSPFSNGFGDTRRTPPLKKDHGTNSETATQSLAENCTPSSDIVTDKCGASEFIADREKVKESDEFKKADEEEWQRRQEELQKQAQEAQRLKKRKKAEAERQLAMESRQKQRVEQIRENQIQEMKNNGIKELMRGQIQSELERKVAGCLDMATVLHRLGIAVEGGVQCTPEQACLLSFARKVNAAYKKAILRFHPDRAAATANNDPRRQLECLWPTCAACHCLLKVERPGWTPCTLLENFQPERATEAAASSSRKVNGNERTNE